MLTYAVLDQNNVVVNVINASSLEVAQSVTSSKCILIDHSPTPGIGDMWDTDHFVYNATMVPDQEIIPVEL